MPVSELFHIMAIVDDIDAAQSLVDQLFDPTTMMAKSWSDFDKRWATISLAGSDFSFELMEPSTADEDAGAPLVKFAKRFGSHLHSLAWYVDRDDEPELAARLIDHGVRVVDPRGGLLARDGLDDLPPTLFTHGRDTFGQLEFQVPGTMRDPRLEDDWSDDPWRTGHPLGLQRLDSTMVLVRDLDRGKALFVDVLEGQLVHEREDDDAARAHVLVGTNTMVELLCPATTHGGGSSSPRTASCRTRSRCSCATSTRRSVTWSSVGCGSRNGPTTRSPPIRRRPSASCSRSRPHGSPATRATGSALSGVR